MTRNNDRQGTVNRESALTLRRAVFGTAIGLCLAVTSAAAREVAAIQNFTAQPELGAVLLTWTVPPAMPASRLVIRFQVDGPAPSSPHAGSPAFDDRAVPGATYSSRQSGLSAQHTYCYAAFALDAYGVVRATTTAVGRPLSSGPPATVQNLRRTDAAVVQTVRQR